jgi:pimeloyl-ACP methyl ester carboxylesterase
MRRRDLLGAGIALPVLSAAAGIDDARCSGVTARASVVLVHGAGHGGWCWRPVADQLREKGYRVFTPTLTGLGERRHLRSPDITLDTHIDDVVNLILAEELRKVVLVGHSYGGTVITGVCDRIKSRIAYAVFLDANTPGDGEPTIPDLTRDRVERMTGEPLLDGYLLPLMNPASLGIDPADVETTGWVQRQLTEQPIQTVARPIKLVNGGTDGLPRIFILTTPPDLLRDWQRAKLNETRNDSSWGFRELLVGHDAMIIAPCETAALLDELITQQLSSGH